MKKIRKNIVTWLMVTAMIVSSLVVPGDPTVRAAAASYDLSVEEGASPLTMVRNQWGDDYIAEILFNVPDMIATQSKVQKENPKIEVTLKVNSISNDTGNIRAMIFTQDGRYNWNQSGTADVAAGREITLSYALSEMEWTDSSLAKLGVRFADSTVNTSSISYSVVSAKVIMGDSDNGSSSGGSATTDDGLAADARESESDYSVDVNETVYDQWYSEFTFSITNHTSSAVSKVQAVLPTSGEPENLQSFESINVVYNKTVGGLIVYYSGEIGAGATVKIGGKIGFKPSSVSMGKAYVRAVNCNPPKGEGTSAGELLYEMTGQTKDIPYAETPVGKHGKLHLQKVDGYGNAPVIVDENGNPYQLRGASSHGIQWDVGYNYVNKGAMQSLRDEWGVNMFRMACYVTQNGYTEGAQSQMDKTIETGVQAAKKLGMYVIVDWHVHSADGSTENPNTTKSWAREFFKKYATEYKDYDNVIFELCNEPVNTQWYDGSGNDLYSYCKEIAGIIRECGSNALIVCGTNTWSQDVDEVAKKPLKDDGFENVLYTVHFYAATHYDSIRAKVRKAVEAETPIFATEFGICKADGSGVYDTANADEWIALFDSLNISYACWSFCNKGESASYLKTSCSKTQGGYVEEDLSTTGIWLVNTYRAHQDIENNTDTKVTPNPEKSAKPGESGGNTETPGSSTKPGETGGATMAPGSSTKPGETGGNTETPGSSMKPGESGGNTETPGSSMKPGETGGATMAPGSSMKPGETGGNIETPGSSAKPGESGGNIATPGNSTKPGETGGNTAAPGNSMKPGESGGNTETPGNNTKPGTSAGPSYSAKPAQTNPPAGNIQQSPAPSTAKPAGEENGQITDSTGTGQSNTKKKKYVRLKKKTIKLRRGKKAKIVIKKKMPGDKVKKYKILKGKKYIRITKKGVVKGRRKGVAVIKVIMKSKASAKCKIIVKK